MELIQNRTIVDRFGPYIGCCEILPLPVEFPRSTFSAIARISNEDVYSYYFLGTIIKLALTEFLNLFSHFNTLKLFIFFKNK